MKKYIFLLSIVVVMTFFSLSVSAEKSVEDYVSEFESILPEGISSDDIPSVDSSSEAVSALMVLGYSQYDAKRAVAGVDQSLPTEEIITLALKKMR